MIPLSERAKILVEMAGSVTELAKIAGIQPPSISDWLNGKTKTIKGSPAAELRAISISAPCGFLTDSGLSKTDPS